MAILIQGHLFNEATLEVCGCFLSSDIFTIVKIEGTFCLWRQEGEETLSPLGCKLFQGLISANFLQMSAASSTAVPASNSAESMQELLFFGMAPIKRQSTSKMSR